VIETDMTGWDWTVQAWELDADAEMRISLCRDASNAFARLIRNRVFCLSLSVFSTSSGKLFAQVERGLQKSGSYNTTSTNSRIRALAALLVGSRWVCTMGDDSLEGGCGQDGLVDRYAELGHVVKQLSVRRAGERFEFCSHWFSQAGVEPSSWPRTFFRLLNQRQSREEFVQQFRLVLRNCPNLGKLLEILQLVGWYQQDDQAREEEDCSGDPTGGQAEEETRAQARGTESAGPRWRLSASPAVSADACECALDADWYVWSRL